MTRQVAECRLTFTPFLSGCVGGEVSGRCKNEEMANILPNLRGRYKT